MKNYKLHHAKNDTENIEEIDFVLLSELIDYIFDMEFDERLVYLFTFQGDDRWTDDNSKTPVIVTNNPEQDITAIINEYLQSEGENYEELGLPELCPENVFLQEFQSWEDAYEVALMMRETCPIE